MIYNIYCVYDKVSDAFMGELSCYANDNAAKRGFYNLYQDCVDKSPNSPVASYPADFELHRLGSLDLLTGDLHADSCFICRASDFV